MRALLLVAGLFWVSSATAQVQEAVLVSFQGGAQGANPGDLTPFAAGYLTATFSGGNLNCQYDHRQVYCGAIYAILPPDTQHQNWYTNVLYAFADQHEGLDTVGKIVVGNSQTLYFATSLSGPVNAKDGNVAELTQSAQGAPWTETIIHQFKGLNDGRIPTSTPYLDGTGNLYLPVFRGTSRGNGGIVEFSPPISGKTKWTETVLRGFGPGLGGPSSSPIPDGNGGFFVSTVLYSSSNPSGAVLHLTPTKVGSPWKVEVLHYFHSTAHSLSLPFLSGPPDSHGNLFGSLLIGLYGRVFELSPPSTGTGAWTYSTIYQSNKATGNFPGAVLMDGAGNLFTAIAPGGSSNCGSVIELSPPGTGQTKWTERTLYEFGAQPDGCLPKDITVDSAGNFLIPTSSGGQFGQGAVVQLSNTGFVVTRKH